MHRLRIALLGLAILAVAACSTSASTAVPPPSAAVPSSQPSVVPTAPASPSAATSSAAASASPAGDLTISLSEWKVIAPSTLKAGKLSFKISNLGTAPHELLMFKSDLAPAAYPTDAAGDIKEEGVGVSLVSDGENIDPGGSQDRTVDLTPGTYLFVCNIPGHFKEGMFTVVTVGP